MQFRHNRLHVQGLTKSFYGGKLPRSVQEVILDLCEFAKAKCPGGCGKTLTPTLYEDFLIDGNFICPHLLSHEDDMTRDEIGLSSLTKYVLIIQPILPNQRFSQISL